MRRIGISSISSKTWNAFEHGRKFVAVKNLEYSAFMTLSGPPLTPRSKRRSLEPSLCRNALRTEAKRSGAFTAASDPSPPGRLLSKRLFKIFSELMALSSAGKCKLSINASSFGIIT